MPQDRAGEPAEPSSPEAGRAWSGHEGAEAFAAVEAGTDWPLGYPFVFKALSGAGREGGVLLDIGCGPGRVAGHAGRALGMRVLGVDASPDMLALAREEDTPGAEYHLVADGRAGGPADACADAAMCNHVLASLPDERTVLEVFTEIHRLLRPGAPFALLTTDPACAGIEYASLRVGEPGVTYGPGEPMRVRLRRTDGTWQSAEPRVAGGDVHGAAGACWLQRCGTTPSDAGRSDGGGRPGACARPRLGRRAAAPPAGGNHRGEALTPGARQGLPSQAGRSPRRAVCGAVTKGPRARAEGV
ncbi:class I SAM-dependent methyltransferase [Streptomyces sp. NPDC059991]|uniref:class I SAM-dependent methyltransferase n=1 Tax=Streptomyces sp. NPDC059991 TaxID=3347028 RepID=UPI00369BA85B